MMGRTRRETGSSLIEFTLVGIPMIFVLISTFEIGRGMWNYHALAYSIKEGTRYASVHGRNCSTFPNTCTVTVAQVTQRILNAGAGIRSNELTLTFTTNAATITCLASTCLSNTTVWPQSPGDVVGSNIQIDGRFTFQSAISMFWPGVGPGSSFGTFTLPASSRETVQF